METFSTSTWNFKDTSLKIIPPFLRNVLKVQIISTKIDKEEQSLTHFTRD